jgi:hypothetical protein
MIMCTHCILDKIGRSLMMYSYVVSKTWNCPIRMSFCSRRRCAGFPLYAIMRTLGAHFANSPDQFVMVERGTITR